MGDRWRDGMESKRGSDATYEPKNALTFQWHPKTRRGGKQAMIRFDLSIELDYNVVSDSDYVFIIQPTTTPYQRVTWEKLSTEPHCDVQEEVHGTPVNRHLRVRARPGPFKLRYDAIVDLVHHFALPADLREVP